MNKNGKIKNKVGFTAIQNTVARDKNLSLKAKGLYLLINSWITLPNKEWLKNDFYTMCREGSKCFNSAWNELKANGYLKTHIYPNHGNFSAEYELLDIPTDPPNNTIYHKADGTISSTNTERANKRYTQKGYNANRTNANGTNNINTTNNTTNNTHTVLYQLDDETLTEEEYNNLCNHYKKEIVDSVIKRIIAKKYHGCLNHTKIAEWCKEKKVNPPRNSKRENNFKNFNEHDADWNEIANEIMNGTNAD